MKGILFLIIINIFAGSKASFADRKRNLDQKISQLESINDPSILSNLEELKKKKLEIETAYRSSDKEKLNVALIEAEKNTTLTQISLIGNLKSKSKELMDSYSIEISKLSEKEKMEKKILQVSEKTKREKSFAYTNLAKADYQNALKFERDKNYLYSISLFKKSIEYTNLAFKTNELKDEKETKSDEAKKEVKN